jgi:hypothetical protein
VTGFGASVAGVELAVVICFLLNVTEVQYAGAHASTWNGL